MPQTTETVGPRTVREELGLGRESMGRLLGKSQKTIERWERGAPVPPEARRLLAQLHEIAKLGLIVYTPKGFTLFLDTPLPQFGDRTAGEMIRHGKADEILAALAADYEGQG